MRDEVESKLRALQAWITAGLFFLLVSTLSTSSWMIWQSFQFGRVAAELRAEAQQSHEALCAFKADIEQRYRDTSRFLKENPNGIPGISPKVIQQSLDNYGQTISSLAILVCR